MLKPSDGLEGVKEFILKVVEDAGPNPCPPIVVGVGIGGTFDKAALLAKKSTLPRPADRRGDNAFTRCWRRKCFRKLMNWESDRRDSEAEPQRLPSILKRRRPILRDFRVR